MVTEKNCKGQGIAKGYGCSKIVPISMYGKTNRKYGLGLSCGCYSKWLLNSEEGRKKIERSKVKAKKDVQKEQKKKRKEEREKLIDYKAKLQDKVNEIVRLIDIGLPCLARGHHANQMHAGHVYSRGSNPTIKFNLHNIHRQSAQSNRFQNDDGLLREGLVNEYGQNYMDFLSSSRQTPALKYSNIEYKEFYQKASKIANELKKAGRIYNKTERVLIRNRINLELGIYKEFNTY